MDLLPYCSGRFLGKMTYSDVKLTPMGANLPLVRGRDWIFIPARVGRRPMNNFPKGKGEQRRENQQPASAGNGGYR
jgi:hypothetical protein